MGDHHRDATTTAETGWIHAGRSDANTHVEARGEYCAQADRLPVTTLQRRRPCVAAVFAHVCVCVSGTACVRCLRGARAGGGPCLLGGLAASLVRDSAADFRAGRKSAKTRCYRCLFSNFSRLFVDRSAPRASWRPRRRTGPPSVGVGPPAWRRRRGGGMLRREPRGA